jgi:hypothetical protein
LTTWSLVAVLKSYVEVLSYVLNGTISNIVIFIVIIIIIFEEILLMMLVVLPFYELLEFGVFFWLSVSSENLVFLMILLFG